ncbi:restriction endonuclease subunit S [Treponema vincentii]|uniref:restriction endonuclease subunit S n=2 Tax=Treponema vincentii TaxID=69710 RepID=UPI0020A40D24|nr:restriction endonuclease subunit S [Treponema vincentii]UTC60779.1 restriction endonuclease subunit S [Treponema vincentii]
MNTTALRQKILDFAIHGKLVKQDPTDENAAVLLEKIRAEKEKKIASGELKRDKNDSYIFIGDDNRHYEKFADGRVKDIEDELPFAVPEGWAWCRLGEIADIARGGSPRPIEDFITDEANGINWIKIGDTAPESKYIISAKEKIKPEGKKHSRFVHAGDFLLTNSMSFGRPYILKINGCIHDGWLVFADIRNYLLKDFLYYGLSSQYIYSSFSLVAAGSTVKNLKANTVKQVLFPLPPIAEQKRIVTAIETIFTQIDILETNKADLQTAVKQAKSKILDLAIHGKLVPQDPADEPASVMLERLRAEKEAKIAAGEIKCRKNDSYIYKNSTDNCYYQKFTDGYEADISDEIPFDVPDGWAWCRLGEIYYHTTGKALKKSNEKGSLKKYITTSNLYWDTFDLSEVRTMYFTDDELDKYTIKKGDLVLCNGGDVGRAAIWSYDKDICYQNHISRMRPKTNGIENRFFLYVLKFYKEQNMLKGKGIGISSLSASDLLSVIIPLPSLFEQQRIVAKIEELFAKLDFITAVLTE